jgi:transcriptional regulator with XRE-family HTH domain
MPPVPVITPDGKQIRQLRRDSGLTVVKLAKKLGRHPQSLWKIEGSNPPTSIEFIQQLAKALGVKAATITISGEDGQDAAAEPGGAAA